MVKQKMGDINWGLRKLRYDIRQNRKKQKEGKEVTPRQEPKPIQLKVPEIPTKLHTLKTNFTRTDAGWKNQAEKGWQYLKSDIRGFMNKAEKTVEPKNGRFGYLDLIKIILVTMVSGATIVGVLKLLFWMWSW